MSTPTPAGVKDDIWIAFVISEENLPKNAGALRGRKKTGPFIAFGTHCFNRGIDQIADWRLDGCMEAWILAQQRGKQRRATAGEAANEMDYGLIQLYPPTDLLRSLLESSCGAEAHATIGLQR